MENINILSWKQTQKSAVLTYTHPNPNKNNQWTYHGFQELNDHAADVIDYWGIRIEPEADFPSQWIEITLTCSLKKNPAPEALITTKGKIYLEGGKATELSFESFDYDRGMSILFKAVTQIAFSAPIKLLICEFIPAPRVLLTAAIKGKPLKDQVNYDFTVSNTTHEIIPLQLMIEREGWQVLDAKLAAPNDGAVEELTTELAVGETKTYRLVVKNTTRFPAFARETQKIVAISGGFQSSCQFVTVAHSEDLLTNLSLMDICEIKEKIQEAVWAKTKFQQLYKQAKNWQVPKIDPKRSYLFLTRQSDEAGNAALMYLLTDEQVFAEKAAAFLREFIRDDYGYLVFPHGGNQELVHEGEFFKHTALAYDRIKHAGLLSNDEETRLEQAFRFFMKIIEDECQKGRVSNWNLAELSGVITCAAVLQDLDRVDFFLEHMNGVRGHIARGILDDGWWYEASIGYNLLAMGLFLEICQIIDKWDYNLRYEKIPGNYASYYNLDEKKLPLEDQIDGLVSDVWGPSENNSRSIEMLVDSLFAFYDEQGVIFGMNDSGESRAVGVHLMDPRFDLAYHLYPKSEMLPLLHTIQPEDRDLLFGLAELPSYQESDTHIYQQTVKADVAGITLLRTQNKDVPPNERYQVSLKTGILGGAHGHYDRLALNSIRRFGKNFYNPENIWYAYHTFMYKFFVQNSITHNMTVVDLKQQDPKEAVTKEVYSGEQLQYALQEITTQWCNPPYGGWRVGEDETFEERCWKEGRYVPLPTEQPAYSVRTDFTEDILQRRATLVTDDYVVIADYLAGNQEHDFDCLFHVSGLQKICHPEAEKSHRLTKDLSDSCAFEIGENEQLHYDHFSEQLDSNPLSSGQFVTECHWFKAKDQVRLDCSVEMSKYNDQGWLTPLRTSQNVPGLLKMALHSVDQEEKEVIIACDPEYYQTQQQLSYRIEADGETLYENQLGTWVLGRDDIRLSLRNTHELRLITNTKYVANEYGSGIDVPLPAVFWGDGQIKTKDGKLISLNTLPYQMKNIRPVSEPNRDYQGGPVKIQTKLMTESLPATPIAENQVAEMVFDLSDIDPKELVVSIGGDYPLGNEADRRRLVSFRKRGTAANFLIVLEQYQDQPMIKKVEKTTTGLKVFLANGKVDEVVIPDTTLAKGEFRLHKG